MRVVLQRVETPKKLATAARCIQVETPASCSLAAATESTSTATSAGAQLAGPSQGHSPPHSLAISALPDDASATLTHLVNLYHGGEADPETQAARERELLHIIQGAKAKSAQSCKSPEGKVTYQVLAYSPGSIVARQKEDASAATALQELVTESEAADRDDATHLEETDTTHTEETDTTHPEHTPHEEDTAQPEDTPRPENTTHPKETPVNTTPRPTLANPEKVPEDTPPPGRPRRR